MSLEDSTFTLFLLFLNVDFTLGFGTSNVLVMDFGFFKVDFFTELISSLSFKSSAEK